jgi:hydroxyacylglutathione hydrolase
VLFPFTALHDMDEIHIGQPAMRVLHTPGHRPESISLLVVNPARSPEPSILLSGDMLFVGDVGRPDLGGPDGGLEQYVRGRDQWEDIRYPGSPGRKVIAMHGRLLMEIASAD